MYSQHAVLALLWVKLRLDEGMRASRAIHALYHTNKTVAIAAALHGPLPAPKAPDPTLAPIQAALFKALLDFDNARASMVIAEATAQHPLDHVVLDVIGPTLSSIGDCWSAGELDVATEHFASNFLRHQLLEWMQTSPPPYHVGPVALACAPDELHEGSLLILGVLLRWLRWPVLYLGQSLPLSDLAPLAEHAKPPLIVFVAMSETTARALADWPLWLDDEEVVNSPIIGYGGRAFTEHPALAHVVPGALLGATLAEGVQRIHRLMLDLSALPSSPLTEP